MTLVLALLALSACAADPTSSGPTDATDATEATDAAARVTTIPANCEIPPGEPFLDTETVEVAEIGEVDGVTVSAALYPHPGYEGNPWSQWGQGIVADDRFYSAIGDHLSVDGNSYLYEYDPSTGQLALAGDVLSYVDHVPGTWGYGKIHSQMVPGPCGEIYFSTYWGSFRDIEFEGNYRGDILFRLDPYARTLAPLGVPVEFHGQASLGSDPSAGLVYGEAVDPVLRNEDIERGPFFVYDVVSEQTVFTGPDEPHVGYRSVLVDAEGSAYYSMGGAELATYDPASGESGVHGSTLPGDWLRAATNPGPDGSVYGVTEDPAVLFAMRPDGSVESLGDALGYTASVALDPDGSRFFYMPGAHGNSADWGSPLIAVDTATGDEKVLTELNELVEGALGYKVGGTYGITVSPDGDTVYMGVNVSEDDSGFGEVALLVLGLP